MRLPIAVTFASLLAACQGGTPPPSGTQTQPARPVEAADAGSLPSPSPSTDAGVAATAAAVTPASVATERAGSDAFSMALFRKVAEKGGNAMVSGTSLRDALGMTYLGARGKTAEELRKVLGLAETPDAAANQASVELKSWQAARGSAELSIANRVWVEADGFKPDPAFVARAERGFGAGAEAVAFTKNPEAARAVVNEWVSGKTKAKIPTLLPPASVTSLTRTVITNAVYFKGTWERAFLKANTTELPFKVDGKATSLVPTMHQKGRFRFAEADGAEVLEMPYGKSRMAMVIVLPKAADGINALETQLSAAWLTRVTSGLAPRELALWLPKTSFKSGGSVKAALQSLGIQEAFTDHADLKGIAAVPSDLYVTDVFHQTFVAIDEEGTEAAAASGVVVATRGLGPVPQEMRVDRPFLFFIRDTTTGRVLFVGRVTDPTKG